MNARNPVYTATGMIDIEVDHPLLGWIPFTASPHDLEPQGVKLFEAAVRGDFGPVKPYSCTPVLNWPRFVGNEKLDLFTEDEQLSIVTATMNDTVVKLAYDRLIGAAFWTYEDPEAEHGLSMLESKGLITAERKAQIVAAMQPK